MAVTAPVIDAEIDRFLRDWRGLAGLCTQADWIDNDTLRWHVDRADGDDIRVFVEFEEVLMEGSGCRAGEALCHGHIRLSIGPDGGIRRARVD